VTESAGKGVAGTPSWIQVTRHQLSQVLKLYTRPIARIRAIERVMTFKTYDSGRGGAFEGGGAVVGAG
jgi:hypothetical protein